VPTQNYPPNLSLNGLATAQRLKGERREKLGREKNFNFLWIVTSPLGNDVTDLFSTPNWFIHF